MTHEGAAGEQQVGTGGIETLVNEEILLFPSEVALHLLHIIIEILADLSGSHVHGMEGAEQGSLVVESLTRIGDEDGGNTKGIVDDEDGRRGIPGRVAACLEGVADTTGGEGRSVGFLLNEQFAGKFLNHTTLEVVFDEGVVLLGCALGQRLEPVGVVGHTILYGPLLDASCHGVGDGTVEA